MWAHLSAGGCNRPGKRPRMRCPWFLYRAQQLRTPSSLSFEGYPVPDHHKSIVSRNRKVRFISPNRPPHKAALSAKSIARLDLRMLVTQSMKPQIVVSSHRELASTEKERERVCHPPGFRSRKK